MNVVVAIKDYTELDRLVRPLVTAGHQVTPVTKYGALLRTLGAMKVDLVLVDWGFGDSGDEQLIKSVRGADPGGPRVLVMIPDRWPPEAQQVFSWGADDLVRRPLCMPEIVLRIERIGGAAACAAAAVKRGAPAEWRDLAFWRDLEELVTADLGATIGMTLTAAPADPSTPLTIAGLSRLLLTVDGMEVVVVVGVDGRSDTSLATLLLGGPATTDGMADVVTELTNVAAGAIKRAALAAGKVFSVGLPQLHAGTRTFALERHWCAHAANGIKVHCLASARSSKPEVVPCGHLREGMVVNSNVLSPTGMLLAAQGTCLTDRSVERLRSMLGDRYAIEVTLPSIGL